MKQHLEQRWVRWWGWGRLTPSPLRTSRSRSNYHAYIFVPRQQNDRRYRLARFQWPLTGSSRWDETRKGPDNPLE